MSDSAKAWNGELVRAWLQSRIESAKLDQAAADRRGYAAQDDYDKAAAEEWVCRALRTADCTSDQAAFALRLKALLGQEDYPMTGVYDDRKFDRHVRTSLRKLTKMARANDGFDNMSRYQ